MTETIRLYSFCGVKSIARNSVTPMLRAFFIHSISVNAVSMMVGT